MDQVGSAPSSPRRPQGPHNVLPLLAPNPVCEMVNWSDRQRNSLTRYGPPYPQSISGSISLLIHFPSVCFLHWDRGPFVWHELFTTEGRGGKGRRKTTELFSVFLGTWRSSDFFNRYRPDYPLRVTPYQNSSSVWQDPGSRRDHPPLREPDLVDFGHNLGEGVRVNERDWYDNRKSTTVKFLCLKWNSEGTKFFIQFPQGKSYFTFRGMVTHVFPHWLEKIRDVKRET